MSDANDHALSQALHVPKTQSRLDGQDWSRWRGWGQEEEGKGGGGRNRLPTIISESFGMMNNCLTKL